MRNRHDPFGKRRFLAIPFILAFAAAAGFAVMWLWNFTLPSLIGAKLITYWQSLALMVLCRLLFAQWGGGRPGGFRPGRHGRHRSQGWNRTHSALRERLMRMNEDERKTFIEEWKKRLRP